MKEKDSGKITWISYGKALRSPTYFSSPEFIKNGLSLYPGGFGSCHTLL